MLLDRFAAQTMDSGAISGHLGCFGPGLKIRSGPNLTQNPMQACRFQNFLLGQRVPKLKAELEQLFTDVSFVNVRCNAQALPTKREHWLRFALIRFLKRICLKTSIK